MYVLSTRICRGFARKQIQLFINGNACRYVALKCWQFGGGKLDVSYEHESELYDYINHVLTKGGRLILIEALSNRDISENACIDKLVDMGLYKEHAIDVYQTLNDQLGFDSDRRIIQSVMNQGYRKGKGLMWVKQKCFSKKINSELMTEVLRDYDEERAWLVFLEKHSGLDRLELRKKSKQCGFVTSHSQLSR